MTIAWLSVEVLTLDVTASKKRFSTDSTLDKVDWWVYFISCATVCSKDKDRNHIHPSRLTKRYVSSTLAISGKSKIISVAEKLCTWYTYRDHIHEVNGSLTWPGYVRLENWKQPSIIVGWFRAWQLLNFFHTLDTLPTVTCCHKRLTKPFPHACVRDDVEINVIF